MDVDRSQVIALLRSNGRDDDAARAATELPARIDPHDHADQQLLAQYGIDVGDLPRRLRCMSPPIGGHPGAACSAQRLHRVSPADRFSGLELPRQSAPTQAQRAFHMAASIRCRGTSQERKTR